MEYCDISSIAETEKAINSLIKRGLEIHAVTSFIEPYCCIAATVARHFGLGHFSLDAILVMLDKKQSRKVLEGTPYAPSFYVIEGENKLAENMQGNLPLVLKASRSAGSKDVYKVETQQQYDEVLADIQRKYPGEPVLAEEYLDGPQFLVETVTVNGTINIIAVIKQEITFTGKFIVTGYAMILDLENQFYRSLEKAVSVIIKKHGLEHGSCHLEIRYVNNEWKLVEINSRISGGAINLFIETAFGLNLVRETLKLALGRPADFEYKYKKETFLQYIIVPREGILQKVTGKEKALNCQGVAHVYIRPKKECIIINPISMSDRYAFVIATGQNPHQARENARNGASQIKFHLREICPSMFAGLGSKEKEIITTVNRNKKYLENTDPLFNNFIMY